MNEQVDRVGPQDWSEKFVRLIVVLRQRSEKNPINWMMVIKITKWVVNELISNCVRKTICPSAWIIVKRKVFEDKEKWNVGGICKLDYCLGS